MSKVFIDTNILVYAMDAFDTAKQKRCRDLLRSLNSDMRGVISTQVMQEFYVIATKKLGADPLVVKDLLNAFERQGDFLIIVEQVGDATLLIFDISTNAFGELFPKLS